MLNLLFNLFRVWNILPDRGACHSTRSQTIICGHVSIPSAQLEFFLRSVTKQRRRKLTISGAPSCRNLDNKMKRIHENQQPS
jgi:hypothetical protein